MAPLPLSLAAGSARSSLAASLERATATLCSFDQPINRRAVLVESRVSGDERVLANAMASADEVDGAYAASAASTATPASDAAADLAAWQCAWGGDALSPLMEDGIGVISFTVQVQSFGKLTVDCALANARGWNVIIASQDEAICRRLRGHLREIRALVRQQVGHDDLTVVLRP